MREPRPYGRVLSEAEALAELRRCSGTQFDPRVVEAFCRGERYRSRSDAGFALASGPRPKWEGIAAMSDQQVNERLAALTAAGTSVWLDQIRARHDRVRRARSGWSSRTRCAA